MKKFWEWLVVSSENPTKLALTVKGFLGTLGGILLMVSPLFHLQIGQIQIDQTIESIVQIVILTATIFSSIVGIAGLVRKVINTFRNS